MKARSFTWMLVGILGVAGACGGGKASDDTSTTSSSSSGAGGGVCAPGSTMPCYGGPAGTEGVGLCKAGAKTCNSAGTDWGACSGDVTPAKEDCNAAGDEDCDGTSCGDALWALALGDAATQDARAIATDASGNVFVAGSFTGSIPLPNHETLTAVTQVGIWDIFLLKLSPKGAVLWARAYGDGKNHHGVGEIGVDPVGDVILTGYFTDQIDFDGTLLAAPTPGTRDIFVVKLSPSGKPIWAVAPSVSALGATPSAMTVSPENGDVLLAGNFCGTVDFGGTSAALGDAVGCPGFLAKLDGATGAGASARELGRTVETRSIALDAMGDVFLGGDLDGHTEVSALDLSPVSAQGFLGARSGFVAKILPDGDGAWIDVFGADQVEDEIESIALDSAGNVVLLDIFNTAIDFGGGTLKSAGGNDIALAKLDTKGHFVWAKEFGDAGKQVVVTGLNSAIAVDAKDNVLLAGAFFGSIDFGAGPLFNLGFADIFVVKLDAGANLLWNRSIGGPNGAGLAGVRVAPGGDIVLAGSAQEALDFGSGLLPFGGTTDIFVAEIAP